jgi:transcription termination/antitermination protein NusG
LPEEQQAMSSSNWYGLYVRPRHEFVVHDELCRKGVETFLPAVTKLRQWKDRKKQVAFPLFPGYLFVNVVPGPEEFSRVIKTRGTVSFISLERSNPTPALPEEINALKIMMESGAKIDIYPELKEGTPVRVKRGIFQGAEGVLEKKDDQDMFMVGIKLLGRSVGVQIHPDDVEAA